MRYKCDYGIASSKVDPAGMGVEIIKRHADHNNIMK
jgi:hypothetical protein